MILLRSHRSLFSSPEWWLFFVAVAVRLSILWRLKSSPYFLPASDDMKFYSDWALRISEGNWTDGNAFYGLPGYAFCLAGIFSTVGYYPEVVGVLQVVFEAFTSVLIFKFANETLSEAGDDSRDKNFSGAPVLVGALAALGWTFYQPAQAFSAILMPNAWLVLAFWSSVWWVRKTRHTSIWQWFGIGLFTGFMAIMVATILFLIPLFIAAILRAVAARDAWRTRLPRVVLAVVLLFSGTLLGASPAWVHNYFVANDPVLLSAHSGLNVWMGNNPEANGYPKIPQGLSAGQEGLLRDSITCAEEAAGHKLKRSEVSKYWSGKADAWVRDHRVAWLALLGLKLRNFWNAFQYDDLSEINLLRDEGVLPPGLRFGLIAALGLPGILIATLCSPRTWWIAAAVLLHMCALLPVFVTERYRLCAVPGLLIFAAFTIWKIWTSLARERWMPAVTTIAGIGFAAWFVSLPQRDPRLWALDPFNTGLKALRVGNLNQAQQKLQTAYDLVPDNAEINFGLGNLWFARKDLERARRFYRRALSLASSHTGALNNLGRLEALSERWAAAEELLRASIAIDPSSVKPRLLLAEIKLATGDLEGARAELTHALALRPNQRELLEFENKLKAHRAP